LLNPFYALDPELFDFQLFRFSFGETLEEAIRNRKSKSYLAILLSNALNGLNPDNALELRYESLTCNKSAPLIRNS
jgi:hypothetical protein